MNIRAALLRPSPAWRQLMAQEGLDWVELESPDEVSGGNFSVLVAPARPTAADTNAISDHLGQGGAVLGSAAAFDGVMESRERYLGYVLASGGFSSAGLIDLELRGRVPREANVLRSPDNSFAAFAGEWKGGVAVVLPFDPGEALADVRAGFRSFYLDRDRLPWERVSLVAKGAVRCLVRDAIIYLHHIRGFPYVHTWYYPDGQRNTFVFRIDTDGAGREEIESLFALLEEHRISASWFLDVKTQGSMLPRYREFAGHDIGVHCDVHRIFKTDSENRSNIERARSAMRAEGLRPVGFAAPYGYWDPSLGKVIDEMGFSYSSEFSWAYDTLPGVPVTQAAEYRTVQVPIHPVSVGILRRAGCPPEAMTRYFNSAFRRMMKSGDPAFFYHHPSHREWGVMRGLFEEVRAAAVPAITMAEFAAWWRRRLECRTPVRFEGGNLLAGDVGDRVWISILTAGGGHAVVPPSREIRLRDLETRAREMPDVPPDILRMREWNMREYIGQVLLSLRSGL